MGAIHSTLLTKTLFFSIILISIRKIIKQQSHGDNMHDDLLPFYPLDITGLRRHVFQLPILDRTDVIISLVTTAQLTVCFTREELANLVLDELKQKSDSPVKKQLEKFFRYLKKETTVHHYQSSTDWRNALTTQFREKESTLETQLSSIRSQQQEKRSQLSHLDAELAELPEEATKTNAYAKFTTEKERRGGLLTLKTYLDERNGARNEKQKVRDQCQEALDELLQQHDACAAKLSTVKNVLETINTLPFYSPLFSPDAKERLLPAITQVIIFYTEQSISLPACLKLENLDNTLRTEVDKHLQANKACASSLKDERPPETPLVFPLRPSEPNEEKHTGFFTTSAGMLKEQEKGDTPVAWLCLRYSFRLRFTNIPPNYGGPIDAPDHMRETRGMLCVILLSMKYLTPVPPLPFFLLMQFTTCITNPILWTKAKSVEEIEQQDFPPLQKFIDNSFEIFVLTSAARLFFSGEKELDDAMLEVFCLILFCIIGAILEGAIADYACRHLKAQCNI